MGGSIKKYIYIAVFVILLVVPTISWAVLSILNTSDPRIMQTLDFDLNEKRLKATLSETINLDTISVEYENYYNDRLPFRSILITLKKNIDAMIEKPYKDNIEIELLKRFSKKKEIETAILYDEAYDGRAYKCFDQAVDIYTNHALKPSEIDEYDSSIVYPLKLSDNQKVIIGQSNWLYLNTGNIEYYTGINIEATGSEIEKRVNSYIELDELCKRLNKKMLIYICPEKEEIYPEYMPTLDIVGDRELPIYIRDYVNEHTDVKYIYDKDQFLKYKKNYILYKKYDSHWNDVGAYLALNSIKDAIGIDHKSLYDEDLKKYEFAYGDLVPFGNIPAEGLTASTEYSFNDYLDTSGIEVTEIVPDISARAFESTSVNGYPYKVFIVGDSFSEGILPYAKKDFSKIYYTSYMSVTKPHIAKQIEDADVIILLFVERNENTALKDVVSIITRMLKNYEPKYEKEIKESIKES